MNLRTHFAAAAATLSLGFVLVQADLDKTIAVTTNNPLVTCTLQPLTKINAQRLLGSDGPMHSKPDDIFSFVTQTNGQTTGGSTTFNVPYFGIPATVGSAHHSSSSETIKRLVNGFSNLHCRYLMVKVTVKNNSNAPIKIIKSEKTGENYLKFNNLTLEPQGEILERYQAIGRIMRILMLSGIPVSALIGYGGLIITANVLDNRANPTALPFGILGVIACPLYLYSAYKADQRYQQKENLKNNLELVDNEKAEDEDDYTTIPAGAEFTDYVFINNAKHEKALDTLNSPETKVELFYQTA